MSYRRIWFWWTAGAVGLFLVGAASGFVFGVQEASLVGGLQTPGNVAEGSPAAVDFSPFWKAWSVINEKYLPTASSSRTVNDEDKVWGAIGGLVDSLGDPYSVFLPPEDNKFFQEEIQGDFGGVGLEIGVRDDRLTVIAPLPNTPAKRAGILAGDQIIQIGETIFPAANIEKAIRLIRGEPGTTVQLTIKRRDVDQPLEFLLKREKIQVPTVNYQTVGGDVFLIRLFNFGATADTLFRGAMQQFKGSGLHKMVLDLRGNPGGYLDVATDIASWFLPEDAVVAIEDRGDEKSTRLYRSRGYYSFGPNLRLMVLVDGGSASASEILAGALSEHGIATLMGEQTFGKGSVQELVEISDDTSLKITVARWLTPKGVSISPDGLKPEMIVPAATSTAPGSRLETEGDLLNDLPLQAALKILKN